MRVEERVLIGVEADVETGERGDYAKLYPRYWQALLSAGALPVILPPTEDGAVAYALMERLSGILLPGGDDFCPERYGPGESQESLKLCPARPLRLASAANYLRAAWSQGKPILGICFGMQQMALLAGGKLIYDIGSQRPGSLDHRRQGPGHTVDIAEDSLLARCLGHQPKDGSEESSSSAEKSGVACFSESVNPSKPLIEAPPPLPPGRGGRGVRSEALSSSTLSKEVVEKPLTPSPSGGGPGWGTACQAAPSPPTPLPRWGEGSFSTVSKGGGASPARLAVHSAHHQAVAEVPPLWRISARAPDGVIEAIEGPGQFCLGLQWHPECTPDDAPSRRLFQSFVNACRPSLARQESLS